MGKERGFSRTEGRETILICVVELNKVQMRKCDGTSQMDSVKEREYFILDLL